MREMHSQEIGLRQMCLQIREPDAYEIGVIKTLSIMGWDPSAKTYVYFETNTLRQNLFSRGTVEGDTWTWNNEFKMNGKPVVGRFTLKQVPPDACAYKFEMPGSDETMKLMMEGKQTRLK